MGDHRQIARMGDRSPKGDPHPASSPVEGNTTDHPERTET